MLGRRTPEGVHSFYRTPEWSVEEPNAPDTGGGMPSGRIALLDAAQDRRGGWAVPGPDLETTAVAVHVLHQAGLSWRADHLRAFLRRCGDRRLGVRLTTGAGATSVGTLWGGRSLYRVLGLRPRYPDSTGASLTMPQRPDGGFGARHRAISTLQDSWRGLAAARLLHQIQEETL